MTEFSTQIQTLANRVLKELKPDVPVTAWELKIKLKVQLSVLYMALGQLIKAEKIRVSADDLSYRVQLLTQEPARQPEVEVVVRPETESDVQPTLESVSRPAVESAVTPPREAEVLESARAEALIVPNLSLQELPSAVPNPGIDQLDPAVEAEGKIIAKTVLGLADVLEANGVLGDPEISTN